MTRNISWASESGIGYSNSVRVIPRRRLFSAIVAVEAAIRTLTFWPLLLATKPSRIRMAWVTDIFQSSLETRNLRSISSDIYKHGPRSFRWPQRFILCSKFWGQLKMSAYRELVIRRDYPCRPACQVPMQVPADPYPRQTPVP